MPPPRIGSPRLIEYAGAVVIGVVTGVYIFKPYFEGLRENRQAAPPPPAPAPAPKSWRD